ncbi:hypothetical protein ADK65_29635 [Streptomyces sp. NRRL B-1140]|nr:hypothetical protein ADK65_29635 [Streptomyces sp. NRRL B-1140]
MLHDREVATAVEWNAHYRHLVDHGATELSVAFDLPTCLGHDSDTPAACGEVGRTGVAVDSVDDMRVLFHGIRLDRVRTSMLTDAPAAVLLLLYELVAEEQGVPAGRLAGSVRNDVLNARITRGAWVFPVKPALRFVADTFSYCRTEIPGWKVVSPSGAGLAAMGASPVQEIAFTLANCVEYLRAAVAAGTRPQDAVSRLAFPLAEGTATPEAVARHGVMRRVWARVIRDGCSTSGPELPAPGRRPRGSWPWGPAPPGDTWEAEALALMARVEALGGAAAAVELGFQEREIARASSRRPAAGAREGPRVHGPTNLLVEARQAERIAKLRAWRVEPVLVAALERLRSAAEGTDNVLYPMKDALRARATLGEVCGVLREVWGTCAAAPRMT